MRKIIFLSTLFVLMCLITEAQTIAGPGSGLNRPTAAPTTLALGGTVTGPTTLDFTTGTTANFLIQKGAANYFSILNAGNVGVGIAVPAYKLDVAGTVNIDPGVGTGTIMRLRVNNGYATLYGDVSSDLHLAGRFHVDQTFYPDGGLSFSTFGSGIALNSGPVSGVSSLTFNSATSNLKMFSDYNASQAAADQGIIMKYNSRAAGIYPRAAFQVYNNADPTEKPFLISSQGFGWLKNSKTDEVAWQVQAAASQTADIEQIKNSAGNVLFNVTAAGKVSIGASNTTDVDYKLFVDKGIKTQKVKVTQAGWPDYVFHQQYKLPSLTEVEKYIKANNHLPEVPSAQEIESDGLNLGDNQATLLKKIEELTLYAIDANKKIEQQQQQINLLQQQSVIIKQLQDEVKKIKSAAADKK
jgi:hypothetical protein